jgi:hypothetical protein
MGANEIDEQQNVRIGVTEKQITQLHHDQKVLMVNLEVMRNDMAWVKEHLSTLASRPRGGQPKWFLMTLAASVVVLDIIVVIAVIRLI